jgi:hypothetical protein
MDALDAALESAVSIVEEDAPNSGLTDDMVY